MMSRRIDGCEAFAALDLEEGVSDDLLMQRKDHLEECEDCRVEQALLAEIASSRGSGALEQLEGITRQCYVDDIVARVDRPEASGAKNQPRPLWNPLSLLSGAALGATATAAVFLILSFSTEDEDRALEDDDGQRDRVSQNVEEPHEWRLLLSTGQVGLGDQTIALGAIAPRGREIRVDGQALFEVAPGELVIFEPQSSFTLEPARSTSSTPQIELHRGAVVASLTPRRERSQGLSIVTERGQVMVTGTVVGVEQRGDDFEVSVLRGVVQTRSQGSTSSLTAGETLVLGTSELRPLGEEETLMLWERTRRLSMVESRDGASVTLLTSPPAAEVLVDEVMMGVTPLHISMRPGHHRVTFRVEDRVVAQTTLDLSPNDVVSRSFTLDLMATTPSSEVDIGTERQDGSLHTPSSTVTTGAGEPRASVDELLSKAQTYRAQREYSKAAASYRELLRLHPAAAESRAALVSLGHIELERLGRPAEALRLYEQYLRGQSAGTLAQEALWGKARALRALGRTSQERQALERFLQQFSGALQSRSVRRRIEELDSSAPAREP